MVGIYLIFLVSFLGYALFQIYQVYQEKRKTYDSTVWGLTASLPRVVAESIVFAVVSAIFVGGILDLHPFHMPGTAFSDYDVETDLKIPNLRPGQGLYMRDDDSETAVIHLVRQRLQKTTDMFTGTETLTGRLEYWKRLIHGQEITLERPTRLAEYHPLAGERMQQPKIFSKDGRLYVTLYADIDGDGKRKDHLWMSADGGESWEKPDAEDAPQLNYWGNFFNDRVFLFGSPNIDSLNAFHAVSDAEIDMLNPDDDKYTPDLLSLLMKASQFYVAPALWAIPFVLAFGVMFGILVGFRRHLHWVGQPFVTAIELIVHTINILPRFAIILVVYPFLYFRTDNMNLGLIVAIAVTYLPDVYGYVKKSVEDYLSEEKYQASIAMGMSAFQIIRQHILRFVCLPYVPMITAYIVGGLILFETSMTYVAFTSPDLQSPPYWSWGTMFCYSLNALNNYLGPDSQTQIFNPWLFILPPVLIVCSIFIFYRIGEMFESRIKE